MNISFIIIYYCNILRYPILPFLSLNLYCISMYIHLIFVYIISTLQCLWPKVQEQGIYHFYLSGPSSRVLLRRCRRLPEPGRRQRGWSLPLDRGLQRRVAVADGLPLNDGVHLQRGGKVLVTTFKEIHLLTLSWQSKRRYAACHLIYKVSTTTNFQASRIWFIATTLNLVTGTSMMSVHLPYK